MLDRFAWHPEPELIGFRDADARKALEELGSATWDAALDWLYHHAMRRPVSGAGYRELRRQYFGASEEPSTAPAEGAPSAAVLAEFRERIAPGLFASQHPGSYSYFTPPPLPMSIAGEV
ncbi:MAG TPA: hypothetical protein VGK12_05770, partial [Actinomycetota bacterium]